MAKSCVVRYSIEGSAVEDTLGMAMHANVAANVRKPDSRSLEMRAWTGCASGMMTWWKLT